MKSILRVLHLTQNPADAEQVHRALTVEGYACNEHVVDCRSEFATCIELGGFDIILSDYRLPGFGGMYALAMARERCPEVPFIFFSNSIGEGRAVDALKRGAANIVLKRSLGRLVLAVRRALQDATVETRQKQWVRETQKTQKILEEIQKEYETSAKLWRTAYTRAKEQVSSEQVKGSQAIEQLRLQARLFSEIQDVVVVIDEQKRIVFWNRAAEELYGVMTSEAIGHRLLEVYQNRWVHPGDKQAAQDSLLRTGGWKGENMHITRSGEQIRVEVSVTQLKDQGNRVGTLAVIRNVTRRTEAEAQLREAHATLEVRVEERTAELTNTNASLQQEIVAHRQDLDAFRQSQQRFTEFMDNLPGFAWMKDLDGRYVFVNRMLGQLEQYQKGWHGKTDAELWPFEIAAQFQANDQKVIANREALQTVESYVVEGKPRQALVSKFPIIEESGEVAMVGGASVDVTERIEAEQRVTRARDFYLRLLDEFPNPIWRSGLGGRCDYFNKAWLGFTGRTLKQELGEGWTDGVHAEDLQQCLRTYRDAFQARCPFLMEYRLRRSDGSYGWLVDSGSPYHNLEGGFAGFLGACLDISERKRAEQVLEQIPTRMLEAQEAERRRVARELHDSVSQTLSLAKTRIQAVEAVASPEESAARQHAAEVRALLDKTLEEVRRISHNLMPSELEDLGLEPAIRSLCCEFGHRTGLVVDLNISNVPHDLTDSMKVAAFRIIQEAFTNIEKHAKAAKVLLRLVAEPEAVRIAIQDDGVGFDPTAPSLRIAEDVRMGLTNMNQRAVAQGGTLQIISTAQGTTIQARIPFKGGLDHWQRRL